ncbi:MAG: tol-pal system protein YbgF [Deltaproteobacteria bacterium]|nr:tol-pal system protein YbgF [Deltaproteobacteria bacterium]
MKKSIPLLLLVCFTFTLGCATTKDLHRVQGDLDRKILTLKEDDAGIRKDIDKLNEAIKALRKSQAEVNADITEMRDSIQNLKGVNEGLRKDISALKEIKEKLDSVSFKINFIENFLGIGKRENHSEGEKTGRVAAKNAIKGKGDKESVYASAYETFKEGKYENARGEFQNFLKQYPNSEYSDNAQFWTGETYYFENKYEKAILEYEKVVKNYPNGNKVPYALLKQGLSFLNLGDKSSARLILQQIIKDYPNTNQARIARAKLVEIK